MPGRLVTETLDHDGGRQVTVYVPSRPPQAVVFAGDGGLVAPWGELLESPALPSTLIVGAHRAESETRRLHEYSPVLGSAPATFDADVFAAHERFFVEDLRDWASARFGIAPGVERTAAFGVSAGAELALSMGLRHPDVYGTVLCASPGAGYPPPARLQGALPRAYLVAGTGEPSSSRTQSGGRMLCGTRVRTSS